jgi:hypothetical protein
VIQSVDEDTRFFITVDAVVWSIFHFVYLSHLLFHLLFAFFMFCLCHLCMLLMVTAVTAVLCTLLFLVLNTIFFFSLLLNSLLPLLLPLFIINCRHIADRLCSPNVFLCFTIAGKKKGVVRLLFVIPDQRRAVHHAQEGSYM